MRVRQKPSLRLTEAGGIAFVEFHLARRGAEFARTMPHSDHGDIWAHCGDRKVSIEVKTTFESDAWHIKRDQNGAEFYCLVHLEAARCYVFTAEEMRTALNSAPDMFGRVALLRRQMLPVNAFDNWEKMSLWKMPMIDRPGNRIEKKRPARTVHYKTVNGEIKTYHYPAVT